MLKEKITKYFNLSDNDKQVIKSNAQKIKNFFTVMDCDDCTEYINNGWGVWDFLIHMEKFLPFLKEEKDYITEDNIQELIDEIDSAIKNVKTSLTINDFDYEEDVIEFIENKYDNIIRLARKIVEVCDEESINKILND